MPAPSSGLSVTVGALLVYRCCCRRKQCLEQHQQRPTARGWQQIGSSGNSDAGSRLAHVPKQITV
jgi:hypothetical protein